MTEQAVLVADIFRGSVHSSGPSNLTNVNGTLFFTADDGVHGSELWRSNGTAAGTVLVADIRTGSSGSLTRDIQLTNVNGTLFFTADDGTHGRELWKSDGTAAGTVLVADIYPGRGNSRPSALTNVNGTLFFSAANGTHGRELWRSNGTEQGTFMVKDIAPRSAWIDSLSSSPSNLTNVNGTLFFTADNGTHGRELWKSDGTAAGTVLVADIYPGSGSSNPSELTNVNGTLFFRANNGTHGRELWKSDGTAAGTVLVADIYPGSGNSHPSALTNVNGTLFFTVSAAHWRELWKSDGTAAGTVRLTGIFNPSELTNANGTLFFTADDGTHGRELWKSDGTAAGTVLVADIVRGSSSSPSELTNVNGTLFFTAPGTHGRGLWKLQAPLDIVATQLEWDIHRGGATFGYEIAGRDLPADTTAALYWATGPDVSDVLGNPVYELTIEREVGEHGPIHVPESLLRAPSDMEAATHLLLVIDPPSDTLPQGKIGELNEENNVLPIERLDVGLVSAVFKDSTTVEYTYRTEGDPSSFTLGVYLSADATFDDSDTRIGDPHTITDLKGKDTRTLTLASPMSFDTELPFVLLVADPGGTITERSEDNNAVVVRGGHLQFEVLARDYVYSDRNSGDPVPGSFYDVDAVFSHPGTGSYALGLTCSLSDQPELCEGADPILVFRGTEPTEVTDLIADLHPLGIGYGQFLAIQEQVEAWLDDSGAAVSFIGHSLGGALAQWFAAFYTGRGNAIGEVVTFNSPGIRKDCSDGAVLACVSTFDPGQAGGVMHYITNGDLVSMAGEAYLDGAYTLSTFSDLNLVNNHVLPVLVGAIGERVRPSDIVSISYSSVDWLSSPLFIFSDLDYFMWLGAAQIAVSTVPALQPFEDIPGRLLFRGTTEATRQQVGEAIHQIIDWINLPSDPTNVEVRLPDVTLNPYGILQVDVEDMMLRYRNTPTESFRIQGRFKLPQMFNTTADFAGDNYIEIRDDGFDVVGQISAKNIVFVPDRWELKEIFVSVDTQQRQLNAGGTLMIPMGIDIAAELGFVDGQFNFILLAVDDINRPIGTTGAFLQRIGGIVDHIAEADPNPIAFGGEVGITAGPEIEVRLPSWAGGTFTGSLARLDVQGLVDQDHLEAAGQIVLVGGLAKGNGNVELNWDRGFLKASSTFVVLDELLTMNSQFTVNSNLDLTMRGSGVMKMPEVVPWLGGQTLASGNGYFQYINDAGSPNANDYVMGWATTDTWLGTYTLGVLVRFDGDWEIISSEAKVRSFAPSLLRSTSVVPAGNSPLAASESNAVSDSFLFETDVRRMLLVAEWENGTDSPPVQVQSPSGRIYTEADMAAVDTIGIVSELSETTRKSIGVRDPEPGLWTLTLLDRTGLGEVEFTAYRDTSPPSIEFTSPIKDLAGDVFTIAYDAHDPDSEARISLFYDTDAEDFDGVLLAADLHELDGPGSFVWDASNVPRGAYHIYAMIQDANNAPVFVYAPGRILVGIHPPEALDIAISSPQDASVTAFFHADDIDSDDDPDTLSYALVSGPSEGSVTVNLDGSFSFDPGGDFQDLAQGETRDVSFTFEATDSHGAVSNLATVVVTVTGVNDAPVIGVVGTDSAAATLTETNAGLTTVGTLSAEDLDTTDTVSVAVSSVAVAGSDNGIGNAALLGMLSLGANPVIDGTSTTGAINWSFDSGSEAFDHLAVGESLVLTYTLTATDSQNASDTQDVVITINGTNDVPTLTAVNTGVTVSEGKLADNSGTFADLDKNDNVTITASVGTITQDTGNNGNWSWEFNTTDGPDETQTVTITADDGHGDPETITFDLTVENVAPAVTSVPTTQNVQYSDSIDVVTFTATDVPADVMNAVVSYSTDGGATFTAGLPDAASISGGVAFAGHADQVATGTWTISGIADLAPGTYIFRAAVSDEDGGTGTAETTVVVEQEDADATYDGPLFVSTDPQDPANGIVPLRAVIRDITAFDSLTDSEAGHITTATVSFINRDTGAVIASGLPVSLLGSDTKVGVATFDWPVTLQQNSTAETFEVGVVVDGYYEAVADNALIMVARPDGNFITGGGYLLNEASDGMYSGGDNLRTNFGFNVKFNKKLTNLMGHFNAIVRRDNGQVVRIKSNATDSLVVDPTTGIDGHATFVSKANLADVTDPENPVSLAGNLQLIVNVTDNGEPGAGVDTISFALWDGATLLFSSNFDGTQTIEQTIAGGNVEVHTDAQALTSGTPTVGSATNLLTADALQPVIADAIGYWAAAGIDGGQLDLLYSTYAGIVDLSGELLGLASERLGAVWIDLDAAGYGWNLDRSSSGGMDLVSAVAHEFGHILGLDDSSYQHDVMGSHLAAGVQRLPTPLSLQPLSGGSLLSASPSASDAIFARSATSVQRLATNGLNLLFEDNHSERLGMHLSGQDGRRMNFAVLEKRLASSPLELAIESLTEKELDEEEQTSAIDAAFADLEDEWTAIR